MQCNPHGTPTILLPRSNDGISLGEEHRSMIIIHEPGTLSKSDTLWLGREHVLTLEKNTDLHII
jgi:beta-lactamase regulating signal transducer with metallopeptidase domain